MKKREFDPVTEGYIKYTEQVKRLVPRTIIDIRCSFRKVQEYTQEHQMEKAIWQLSLEEYIRWMGQARDQGKNARSLNKHLSHLRGLIEYAWRSGRTDRNVLEGYIIKDAYEKQLPKVLTLEEAESLIQESGGPTAGERRSRLIVLLCYGCGLRTSEVLKLNVQDIDREKQEIMILNGKGNKDRNIPVPEGVWTELMAYLADRGGKRGALLKTAVKKKRIGMREINDIIREMAEQAGISQKVTPRVLRHSFATHLMEAGVDIGVISMLMGHRSPRETGVYLHALEKSKGKAFKGNIYGGPLYGDKEEEQ